MRVYVCGPMRGYPEFNFPAFDRARDAFKRAGFDVISPADLDRASKFNEKDATPDQVQAMTDQFIDRDVAAIRCLRPDTEDGLVLLEGWERSTGAKAEVALALWRRLKFYNEAGSVIYPVLSGGSY